MKSLWNLFEEKKTFFKPTNVIFVNMSRLFFSVFNVKRDYLKHFLCYKFCKIMMFICVLSVSRVCGLINIMSNFK